jgi:mannose-6-phosphate isomerase-like protein (cupin superfamily)
MPKPVPAAPDDVEPVDGTALQIHTVERSSAPHYTWGTGCDGWRLVDGDDLSVIEERVPPGGCEEWHVHDQARQFFYVLSGRAEMRTAVGVAQLGPGVGVEVPPGVAHQFANVGESDVVFLVTSTPTTRGDRRASRAAVGE